MKMHSNIFFHRLGTCIGIPLIYLAGKMRKRRRIPAGVQTVGLLLHESVCETILLQALLKDIRASRPETRIVLFCPKPMLEIARLIQNADEVVVIHPADFLKATFVLRSHPVDILIDTKPWGYIYPLLCTVSGAQHIRGFETKGQYRHYGFDSTVTHRNDVHEVSNLKRLHWQPAVEAGALPQIALVKMVKAYPNRIVLHMKSDGVKPHKHEWPFAAWNEVVSYLLSRGMEIYFTGTFSDYPSIDKFIATFFAGKLVNVAGTLGVADTAALMKSASLVISVNTGITQLASALGCNVIAMHGPSSHKRWGPLNANAFSLQSPHSEAPCCNLGFEYTCHDRTSACMKAIAPASVIKAIEKILPPAENSSTHTPQQK